MSIDSTTNPEIAEQDQVLDAALRPRSFEEYSGQEAIKKSLDILLRAAKERKEPIEHVLLYGGAGLGKTTLAHIIARTMEGTLKITSGPAIEKIGDLASLLTNLERGDILFIDEAHRLNKTIEEVLYPAMEDFALDIVIGKGPSARTLQLAIPRFTLIAATTRIGMLSSPLRSRFGITYRLEPYSKDELFTILNRSSSLLGTTSDEKGLKLIAERSRSTPRIANRLLKRVRDFAQVESDGVITKENSEAALSMLEIDKRGLEPTDRRILNAIIKTFNGGPVGLQTLAATAGEEEETITDVYEPYLLQIGFLARTPKGRVVTDAAYTHLGLIPPKDKQSPLL